MNTKENVSVNQNNNTTHPMMGKYCVVRTYSAGVHIGREEISK